MAHFAELDTNNVVTRILVVDNAYVLDSNGQESEEVGIDYLKSLFGSNMIYKQTSYNNNFRVRYAYPGCTYDAAFDAFIPPKPSPSATFNLETLDWDDPSIVSPSGFSAG